MNKINNIKNYLLLTKYYTIGIFIQVYTLVLLIVYNYY